MMTPLGIQSGIEWGVGCVCVGGGGGEDKRGEGLRVRGWKFCTKLINSISSNVQTLFPIFLEINK